MSCWLCLVGKLVDLCCLVHTVHTLTLVFIVQSFAYQSH